MKLESEAIINHSSMLFSERTIYYENTKAIGLPIAEGKSGFFYLPFNNSGLD
jgi:hypothetical protein